MRTTVFPCALALATTMTATACVDTSSYPVKPSESPVPGTAPTAATLFGRVCLVGDARSLASCSTTASAANLTVAVGDQTTTTAADGTFTVPATALASGVTTVGVSGNGIVPTQASIASPLVVPAVDANLFSQMLADNGIVLASGSGSIIGSVTRADGSIGSAVHVTSTPSPAFGPFYDGSTPTAWTLDGTGARGVVWIPGATAGTNVLTFADGTGGETTVGGVQVVDGGLTIVDAVLP